MEIKEILEKYKNITVVGMSSNPSKASHNVPRFMKSFGYDVVPVNPTVKEILGMTSYPDILSVPDKIEILNVFQRSEACLNVVQEAVERKNQKGDIDVIWLQEGIENEAAKELAESNGIVFVQDRCIYKEHDIYF